MVGREFAKEFGPRSLGTGYRTYHNNGESSFQQKMKRQYDPSGNELGSLNRAVDYTGGHSVTAMPKVAGRAGSIGLKPDPKILVGSHERPPMPQNGKHRRNLVREGSSRRPPAPTLNSANAIATAGLAMGRGFRVEVTPRNTHSQVVRSPPVKTHFSVQDELKSPGFVYSSGSRKLGTKPDLQRRGRHGSEGTEAELLKTLPTNRFPRARRPPPPIAPRTLPSALPSASSVATGGRSTRNPPPLLPRHVSADPPPVLSRWAPRANSSGNWNNTLPASLPVNISNIRPLPPERNSGHSKVPTVPSLPSDKRKEMALAGKQLFTQSFMPQSDSVDTKPSGNSMSREYARVEIALRSLDQNSGSENYVRLEENDVVEIIKRNTNGWLGVRLFEPIRGNLVGPIHQIPAVFVETIDNPYDPFGENVEELRLLTIEKEKTEAENKRHNRWLERSRLFLSAFELIENEFNHVTNMMICQEVYVEPIGSEFGSQLVGSLFPSWQAMTKTHQNLLQRFHDVSLPFWQQMKSLPTRSGSMTSASNRIVNSKTSRRRATATIDMRAISAKLNEMESWHGTEIVALEKTLSDSVYSMFGDLLSEWSFALADSLESECESFAVSTVYIRNYSVALKKLKKYMTSIDGFKETIERCAANPLARKAHVSGFLIKPVQHLCRYPLLVREISKYAPSEALRDRLLDCRTLLVTITTEINAEQSLEGSGDDNLDSMKLIDVLRSTLRYKNDQYKVFCEEAFARPSAQVLKSGDLEILKLPSFVSWEKVGPGYGKVFTCFLLNSFLIVAKQRMKIMYQQERYTVRGVIPMTMITNIVNVTDSTDSGAVFALSVKEHRGITIQPGTEKVKEFLNSELNNENMLVFSVKSVSERSFWLRSFEQAISITRDMYSDGIMESEISLKTTPTPEQKKARRTESNMLASLFMNKSKDGNDGDFSNLNQSYRNSAVINELQRRLESSQSRKNYS